MSENDAAGWPSDVVEMSEGELQTICDAIRFGLNLHGETHCTSGEECLGVKRMRRGLMLARTLLATVQRETPTPESKNDP